MNSVCSVIILYNPSSSVIENINANISQSDYLILVDNGSSSASLDKIKKAFENIPEVEIILNGANLGIATALNIGVRRAKSMRFSWIATFDQDSLISDGFIAGMLDSYCLFPDNKDIRMISPLYRDMTTGKTISAGANAVYNFADHDFPFNTIETTITSGNLIKARLFDEIGYFDDGLFIDMVDHDFCLRCVGAGYLILETARVTLNHNLGSPKQIHVFNRSITTTNHSPVRRYYMMRNRVHLYRKHRRRFSWIIKDASIFFGRDIPKILLLEDDKLVKLYMIFKGWFDGVSGKTGPIDV